MPLILLKKEGKEILNHAVGHTADSLLSDSKYTIRILHNYASSNFNSV